MSIAPRLTGAIGFTRGLPIDDPQSLTDVQVPVGEIGGRDLLVEVVAVSVNPVDVKVRASTQPQDTPRVIGYDAAGIVREVGAQLTRFAPGDEVFYSGSIERQGTNARLHVVDERLVGTKPTTLDFGAAAALPLTTITAWESLFDRLGLAADSTGTLLVIGATGGVGSLMIQLAHELAPGVRIIATASNPEGVEWVNSLGADDIVNHHGDLAAQLQEIAPEGVDMLFTAHSDGQLELYAQILRPFGQIVAIDDGPRDVSPLKTKSITWHWELMFTRSSQHTADMVEQGEILNRVALLVDTGRIRTTETRRLRPLTAENLREAHRLVESGRQMGKIVLTDEAD
ncbi:zinc-binding alcohol dehydrogenase family protein [soil metagenome]